MPLVTHKNCNVNYAQTARQLAGMTIIEAGTNSLKMNGTEKQFRDYRKCYKAEASKNGIPLLTGEFLIEGCKMTCML